MSKLIMGKKDDSADVYMARNDKLQEANTYIKFSIGLACLMALMILQK